MAVWASMGHGMGHKVRRLGHGRIDPAVIEAIRTEYITSPDLPSMATLGAKYGISRKTIQRYASAGQWRKLRDARVQAEVEKAKREASRREAETYIEELEKTKKILRYVRDSAVRLYKAAYERLLAMAEEGKLEASELARITTTLPKTIAETVKALELISGRPTERHEVIDKRDIELTPEEEEMLARVWAKVSAYREGT